VVPCGALAVAAAPLRAEEMHKEPGAADYVRRYLVPGAEVGTSDPVFWVLVGGGGAGAGTLSQTLGDSRCLLLFTSPIKAGEYLARHPDLPSSIGMLAWSADRCVTELARLRVAGDSLMTIDPACGEAGSVMRYEAGLEGSELMKIWLLHRLTARFVASRVHPRLRAAVQAHRFRDAAQNLDDLVRCVCPEEPRLLVLLGACAIALDDAGLLRAALRNLRALDPATMERVRSTAADARGRSKKMRFQAADEIAALEESVGLGVLTP
jgi:hypothetical protein